MDSSSYPSWAVEVYGINLEKSRRFRRYLWIISLISVIAGFASIPFCFNKAYYQQCPMFFIGVSFFALILAIESAEKESTFRTNWEKLKEFLDNQGFSSKEEACAQAKLSLVKNAIRILLNEDGERELLVIKKTTDQNCWQVLFEERYKSLTLETPILRKTIDEKYKLFAKFGLVSKPNDPKHLPLGPIFNKAKILYQQMLEEMARNRQREIEILNSRTAP